MAAIATGTNASGTVTMGVAPDADLHLHSYSYDFQPSGWTTGTSSAETAGAIVQNNSWGYDDDSPSSLDITTAKTYKTNNSATGAATLVYYQSQDTDGDGFDDIGASSVQKSWTEANWNSYVSALNSFQDTGVIVWALSTKAETNADISAGLPELFTELKEAWITV